MDCQNSDDNITPLENLTDKESIIVQNTAGNNYYLLLNVDYYPLKISTDQIIVFNC